MSTVTLTQTDNGSAAIAIEGKVVYGTDFYLARLNHFVLPIVDGTEKVYDQGPSKLYGLILMKDISISDKNTWLDWLEDDIIFGKNRFTISALSGVNWGLGDNTAVTNCRFNGGKSSKDVFEFAAPGIYTASFKYMAVFP